MSATPEDSANQPLGIAVSGAGGLIGRAAIHLLEERGHDIYPMVRRKPANDTEIEWNTKEGLVRPQDAPPLDAVLHLAGENLAALWTRERKRAIRDSRVDGTARLVESLGRIPSPPSTFLCASAVGYYGPERSEPASEQAPPGSGFLAEVCRDWEASADQAKELGARVVNLRFGIVMAKEGGILAKIRTPFRLALGGRLGSGKQWMPWIADDDVAGAIFHVLHSDLHGPVNVTAPQPVTNSEFTETLAKILSRPAILPVPAFALRLALGEMADEMLLASTHAVPGNLLDSGYVFRYRRLEPALRSILG